MPLGLCSCWIFVMAAPLRKAWPWCQNEFLFEGSLKVLMSHVTLAGKHFFAHTGCPDSCNCHDLNRINLCSSLCSSPLSSSFEVCVLGTVMHRALLQANKCDGVLLPCALESPADATPAAQVGPLQSIALSPAVFPVTDSRGGE